MHEVTGRRPLLSVEGLSTSFATSHGVVKAVDCVSLDVCEGETLGIVGESGSGKSVLMRTVMGLLPPRVATTTGRVHYDGTDLMADGGRAARRLWGTEIAMVFQDPLTALNPTKRVGAHLTESLRHHLRLGRREARDRAVELLHQVGIPDPARRAEQYPHELSGGMRQRVTIAGALACGPRLLIADEPTTALDVTVQKQILDLLADVQAEHRMAMVLITHDLGVVAGRADRVHVMYAGRLVEAASTTDLFAAPRHPYTEGLLASIPRIERPSHLRLQALPGRPPDLTEPAAGCRFSPRCKYTAEPCLDAEPGVHLVAPRHAVSCWAPVAVPDVGSEAERPVALVEGR